MTRRGDIVVMDFPSVSGAQSKKRPALIVQCDRDNQALETTIVAMISGNVKLAGKGPTQVLRPCHARGEEFPAAPAIRGEMQ
jgi:mRNA-degrading endonuclease toxin of MazEF toxin-antitoxin module